jgi:maleylacetoacetate isomerase
MKLYSYFRSSASFRVRIALNLKGLPYEYLPVHLVKHGGEQFSLEFLALNPQGLIPVLIDGDKVLTQSLAILEYLDETYPEPPLLPADALGRARVRSIALAISCEIHPINNIRVLRYLKRSFGIDDEGRKTWARHWSETGLAAVEAQLATLPATGAFCHGDTPTIADLCLVPQVFNSRTYDCDFSAMPTIVRIVDRCMELDAFRRAAWEAQPDAE